MLGLRGRGKRRNRSISLVMAALLAGATSIFMFGGTAVASGHSVLINGFHDPVTAGDSNEFCFELFNADNSDDDTAGVDLLVTTTDPQAELEDSTPTTDANGEACIDIIFETAGTRSITVVDTDDTTREGDTRSLLVEPNDAEVLYCITPATVVAGVPFQFTVWAADDFDNETTEVDSDLDIHFFVTPEDAANVLPGTTEWPAGASRVTLTATLWTSGAIMVFTDGDENLQDEDDPQLVCAGILVTTPAPTPASSGGAAAAAATTSTLPSFTG
jgi:hypothetical protein